MRDLLAVPAFYLVSRAPEAASMAVSVSLVVLLGRPHAPALTALLALAGAVLGAMAVMVGCTLPLLPTTDGGRRTVYDACWQAADSIACWAGWDADDEPINIWPDQPIDQPDNGE
jgi:hypothetical protein